MSIIIDVEDARWLDLAGVQPALIAVAQTARGESRGDVAILLTSDDEVRVLNRDWRKQDKPTNVLSFPAPANTPTPDGQAPHLGDLALAFETIQREAIEQGKTPLAHSQHLVAHGILHLLGYDHETETQAQAMETRERMILARFDIQDPYA